MKAENAKCRTPEPVAAPLGSEPIDSVKLYGNDYFPDGAGLRRTFDCAREEIERKGFGAWYRELDKTERAEYTAAMIDLASRQVASSHQLLVIVTDEGGRRVQDLKKQTAKLEEDAGEIARGGSFLDKAVAGALGYFAGRGKR